MNNNICYYCREIIPEGRQVCWICEHNIMEGKNDARVFERTKDEVSKED
jgi:hypothetical protein